MMNTGGGATDQLQQMLGPALDPPQQVTLGGYDLQRSHGRQITIANTGLRTDDGERAHGFTLCLGCGYAEQLTGPVPDPPDNPTEPIAGHRPFCPARKDPKSELLHHHVWLTAQIRGDVMELALPEARDPGAFTRGASRWPKRSCWASENLCKRDGATSTGSPERPTTNRSRVALRHHARGHRLPAKVVR